MSGHERSFWLRLELLVMAAACGTLLGTGLLAGVISFGDQDIAAQHSGNASLSPILIRSDETGAYRAHVIIDGIPLTMIVDTGAARTRLSLHDAHRLIRAAHAGQGEGDAVSYRADRVELGGRTLQAARLELDAAATASVMGQDWLQQLGPVTLDPS